MARPVKRLYIALNAPVMRLVTTPLELKDLIGQIADAHDAHCPFSNVRPIRPNKRRAVVQSVCCLVFSDYRNPVVFEHRHSTSALQSLVAVSSVLEFPTPQTRGLHEVETRTWSSAERGRSVPSESPMESFYSLRTGFAGPQSRCVRVCVCV